MSLSKSEQARINGANSRGPKTAAGKARSSQNAITHGIFAKNVVLAAESKQDFDGFVQDYVTRFQPADEPELNLVEQMVHCTWRKHRLLIIGTALMDTMLHELDPSEYPLEISDYALNLVRIFRRPNEDAGSALERLRLLEESLDRMYDRALRNLQTLRKFPPSPVPEKVDDTKVVPKPILISKNEPTKPPQSREISPREHPDLGNPAPVTVPRASASGSPLTWIQLETE